MKPENDPEPKGDAEGDDKGTVPAKFVPPKDGSWIPRERLDEAVGKHRSRADAAEARLAALEAERAQEREEQKPQITRAQLAEAVSKGQLTEEQAEARWEQQLEARVTKKVEKTVVAQNAQQQQLSKVDAVLKQYRDAIPDIAVEGSAARAKVTAEFNHLVDVLGEPNSPVTEAKACRMAFGAPERIKELTRERQNGNPESGGGGGGGNDPAPKKFEFSASQKVHYQSMIDAGHYTGWNDPVLVKEREFAAKREATRAQ